MKNLFFCNCIQCNVPDVSFNRKLIRIMIGKWCHGGMRFNSRNHCNIFGLIKVSNPQTEGKTTSFAMPSMFSLCFGVDTSISHKHIALVSCHLFRHFSILHFVIMIRLVLVY